MFILYEIEVCPDLLEDLDLENSESTESEEMIDDYTQLITNPNDDINQLADYFPENVENLKPEVLRKYIITYLPSLWRDCKVGDLIDVCNTVNPIIYGVDYDNKQKILLTDYDYHVPKNFYTFTRFPVNSHKIHSMKADFTYTKTYCGGDDEYRNYSSERIERNSICGAIVPFDPKIISKIKKESFKEFGMNGSFFYEKLQCVTIKNKNKSCVVCFFENSIDDAYTFFTSHNYFRLFSYDDSRMENYFYPYASDEFYDYADKHNVIVLLLSVDTIDQYP